MRTLVLILCLILVGCASCAGNAELIRAMASDPATACITITSIYGTVRISRTNIQNGDVSCSQDGLAVKSQGVTSVPVKVTPITTP